MNNTRLFLGIGLLCAVQSTGIMAAIDQEFVPDKAELSRVGQVINFANEVDAFDWINYKKWLNNFDPNEPEASEAHVQLHARIRDGDPSIVFYNPRARERYLRHLNLLIEAHTAARIEYEARQQAAQEAAHREQEDDARDQSAEDAVSEELIESAENQENFLVEHQGHEPSDDEAHNNQADEYVWVSEDFFSEPVPKLSAAINDATSDEEDPEEYAEYESLLEEDSEPSDSEEGQHEEDHEHNTAVAEAPAPINEVQETQKSPFRLHVSGSDDESSEFTEDISRGGSPIRLALAAVFTDEDSADDLKFTQESLEYEHHGTSEEENPESDLEFTEEGSEYESYEYHGTSDDESQKQDDSGKHPNSDQESVISEDLSEEFTDAALSEKDFVSYVSNGTSDDEAQSDQEDELALEAEKLLSERVPAESAAHGSMPLHSEQERSVLLSEPDDQSSAILNEPENSSDLDLLQSAFHGRFYVDAAGKRYLVIGRRSGIDVATGHVRVSSEEFIRHVGPVLEKFIVRCGQNFGGILTTDFESDDALVPLLLTDREALEAWIAPKKDDLRLGGKIYPGSDGGYAIGIVSQKNSVYPKNPIRCSNEGVFYNGEIVGGFKDGTLITHAELARQSALEQDAVMTKGGQVAPASHASKRQSSGFGKNVLVAGLAASAAALVFAGMHWLMSPPSAEEMKKAAEGVFEPLPVDRPSVTSFTNPFSSDGGTGAVTSYVNPHISDGGTGAMTSYTTLPWTREGSGTGAVVSYPGGTIRDGSSVPSGGNSENSLSDGLSSPTKDGSSAAEPSTPAGSDPVEDGPANDSLFTDEDMSSYPLAGGNYVPSRDPSHSSFPPGARMIKIKGNDGEWHYLEVLPRRGVPSCPSDASSGGSIGDGLSDASPSTNSLSSGSAMPPVKKTDELEFGSFAWWQEWWKNNKNNLPNRPHYKRN